MNKGEIWVAVCGALIAVGIVFVLPWFVELREAHGQSSDIYEVSPLLPDFGNLPDQLEPGSFFNPYVVEGDRGDAWEVSPTFPDLDPNDRWMEPGSLENPLVIERAND